MADYDVTLSESTIPDLLERPNALAQLVESVLQQVLGLMEMVVNGVSTRKVSEITEALCGTSFSKSTVSRLRMGLDVRVNAFLSRRLEESYPFIIVDALFTKSRCDDRVMSKALLIVGGIRGDGYRDILGISIGDAESAATWNELFASLKRRGLSGVDFVISDDHAGLVEAVTKQFAGTTWQRCQVHVMRNMLGHCPSRICCRRKTDLFIGRCCGSASPSRRSDQALLEDGSQGCCVPRKRV